MFTSRAIAIQHFSNLESLARSRSEKWHRDDICDSSIPKFHYAAKIRTTNFDRLQIAQRIFEKIGMSAKEMSKYVALAMNQAPRLLHS